jgi:Helix-hairpin-helix motif
MELPVRDAKDVALNTASEDELSVQVGLGPERASRIMASRPFRSWEDVRRVEGLTDAIVNALQRAGAVLGDADAAVVVPREEERMLRPEERDVEIRGKRL